ncbi:uncharacterized protein LOC134072799 [Sardina pilchardus]|uniref:uncharacterized protein LOC134072799 n=1 Tax=Sardina pilchardus TaxID=27697 RepID=UPI002E0E1FB1
MPCCAAYGCSVRPGRDKRVHYFPRDPTRRKRWEQGVRRKDWTPNNYSLLCEDHFEESQYESHRADGLRKLKPNAVPTKFVFSKPERKRNSSKRPPKMKVEVGPDHAYCSKSLDRPTAQPEMQGSDFSADDGRQQGIPDPDPDPDSNHNHVNLDLTSNNPTPRAGLPHASCPVNCEEKLKALTNKVLRLELTLAKERREKWRILQQRRQLEEKVLRVFNRDQLAKLCQVHEERKLHEDRAAGYQLLLAQKQPLPSVRRSLRRRLTLEKRSPLL